ncbi:MAG: CtsR family transcriptional regulator [Clostridiales bacterium]|nr:CtsR family transcriptional regulator [Clostridiales bacterium]
MRLSDIISEFILEALREQSTLELTRSELADRFNCVPSQINYVIQTRFTPEHGYSVESRRGGGGFIRISRANHEDGTALMHAINSVGDSLSVQSAEAILRNLVSMGLITERDTRIIGASASTGTMIDVPPERRAALRAKIVKNCLICINTLREDE